MGTIAQERGITEFPYTEYDSNDNQTYWEDSDGYWLKKEYDSDGNVTRRENSSGVIQEFGMYEYGMYRLEDDLLNLTCDLRLVTDEQRAELIKILSKGD